VLIKKVHLDIKNDFSTKLFIITLSKVYITNSWRYIVKIPDKRQIIISSVSGVILGFSGLKKLEPFFESTNLNIP